MPDATVIFADVLLVAASRSLLAAGLVLPDALGFGIFADAIV